MRTANLQAQIASLERAIEAIREERDMWRKTADEQSEELCELKQQHAEILKALSK